MSLDAAPDGLRERKRTKIRSVIRAHAMRLFLKHGYDEVTVEQIAAEAEVSASTVFRYFTTKEAIVFADGYDDKITAAFEQKLAASSAPRALAEAMREVTATLSRSEQTALHERNKLVLSNPILRAAVPVHLQDSFSGVRDALARRTGLHPDDFAIRVFVGAMQGIWMTVYLEWGDRPLPEMVDNMARAMELVDEGLAIVPGRARPRAAARR